MQNLNSYSTAKRPRVDPFSDSWDDDFDEGAIDDCFEKATQERQKDDITLLTSYSIFKEPKQMFTSTQIPHTSGSNHFNLETKFKELETKYAEKEGEASILRTNLFDLRASSQADREKKQMEFHEKLAIIEKESKTYKSELELKKLEIANLKQQVAELSKVANVEQFSLHKSFSNVKQENEVKATLEENSRIFINQAKFSGKELNLTNAWLKCFKTTTSHLQNMTETDKIFLPQDMETFTVNCENVRIEENGFYMPNVVATFFQLMQSFRDCLKEIEDESLRNKEKYDRESSLQFLRNTRITKISHIISTTIEVFGEILPYNSSLRHYLLTQQSKHLTDFFKSEVTQPSATSGFFIRLSHIMSLIRRVGKERECSSFLSALITLLCKLIVSEDFQHLSQDPVMEDILTDLLLLNHRGSSELIGKTSTFLSIITHTSNLDNFDICLCSYNKDNLSKKDSCRFQMYIASTEATLLSVEDQILFSEISANILDFTYNIFRSEKVVAEQENNKTSSCITKLSKLATAIIYRQLVIHKTESCKKETLSKSRADVLRLLAFNAFELTQKDISDTVRFKEIMYCLNGIENGHVKHLEKMCPSDDFETVPKEKFTHVNF